MRHKDPELMKKIHDFAYPPNNIPLINKLSPSCGSGITDSYVFTNLLHRSIPGHQFLKDIRICQELHA